MKYEIVVSKFCVEFLNCKLLSLFFIYFYNLEKGIIWFLNILKLISENLILVSFLVISCGCGFFFIVDICNFLKGILSRFFFVDINFCLCNLDGNVLCNNEFWNRLEGDGKELVEGEKDKGFNEDGDGGKWEGVGFEGDGGGSRDCKLLFWSLLWSDGGCGGGFDVEGVDGDVVCRVVCIVSDIGWDVGGEDWDICFEWWFSIWLCSWFFEVVVLFIGLLLGLLFNKFCELFFKYFWIIWFFVLFVLKGVLLCWGDLEFLIFLFMSWGLLFFWDWFLFSMCFNRELLDILIFVFIEVLGIEGCLRRLLCEGVVCCSVWVKGELLVLGLFSIILLVLDWVIFWEFVVLLLLFVIDFL